MIGITTEHLISLALLLLYATALCGLLHFVIPKEGVNTPPERRESDLQKPE
jgi:hypothetical protein